MTTYVSDSMQLYVAAGWQRVARELFKECHCKHLQCEFTATVVSRWLVVVLRFLQGQLASSLAGTAWQGRAHRWQQEQQHRSTIRGRRMGARVLPRCAGNACWCAGAALAKHQWCCYYSYYALRVGVQEQCLLVLLLLLVACIAWPHALLARRSHSGNHRLLNTPASLFHACLPPCLPCTAGSC
jgi:hypothetical protein